MKSILIAITVMVAGLSSGCAQMDQLAKQYNPDNAQFPGLSADPQNNQGGGEVRSGHFCYGDRRDDALWQCAGYETPAQIALKAEQAKIAEANARIAAKNQAIADAKQAAIDKIANDKATKLQAIADQKRDILVAKREAAEARQNAIALKKYEEGHKIDVARQAAKVKADAAMLEAARIERRDHPEIGRKRDMARMKAEMVQKQAEEDVYRANHNGRSEQDDQMQALEGVSRQFTAEQKLRQDLGLKAY